MKVIVVYENGAWKFYALVKTSEMLSGLVNNLSLADRKYKVIDVATDDFNHIESIIEQLNS